MLNQKYSRSSLIIIVNVIIELNLLNGYFVLYILKQKWVSKIRYFQNI